MYLAVLQVIRVILCLLASLFLAYALMSTQGVSIFLMYLLAYMFGFGPDSKLITIIVLTIFLWLLYVLDMLIARSVATPCLSTLVMIILILVASSRLTHWAIAQLAARLPSTVGDLLVNMVYSLTLRLSLYEQLMLVVLAIALYLYAKHVDHQYSLVMLAEEKNVTITNFQRSLAKMLAYNLTFIVTTVLVFMITVLIFGK